MKQWYYLRAGQQTGPIAEVDFVRLVEVGELAPDTLVWTEELKEWTAARDVHGLVPPALNPPSHPVSQPTMPPQIATQYRPSGAQVRPWVRYWARMFDSVLFSSLAGILLAVVYEPELVIPDVLFGIILLFAYVFVEAAMLTGWGTTPGKALLKVRLRNGDDTRLSYADALSRAFKVLARGRGFGVPIVSWVTLIYACNRLSKQGITSWDEDGNFTVSHQTIDVWRIILVVLILLAVIMLIAIGNMPDSYR